MISICEQTDGCLAPMILCDHCGGVIKDAELAAAVPLLNSRLPNGNAKVAHVHKGPCHKAVELASGATGWDELTLHLRLLLQNAGIDLLKLKEQGELEKRFGMTNE